MRTTGAFILHVEPTTVAHPAMVSIALTGAVPDAHGILHLTSGCLTLDDLERCITALQDELDVARRSAAHLHDKLFRPQCGTTSCQHPNSAACATAEGPGNWPVAKFENRHGVGWARLDLQGPHEGNPIRRPTQTDPFPTGSQTLRQAQIWRGRARRYLDRKPRPA